MARRPASTSPRAAIMPMSAGSHRARCRRTAARSRKKACCSKMCCWSMKGGSASRNCATLLAAGPYPARNVDQNIADLKAQVAACARGAAGLERACARTRPRRGRSLYAPRARQCRGSRAAADRAACGRRSSPTRWTTAQWCRWRCGSIGPARSVDHRLHRHQRPAARQFQRPVQRGPRRGAVCPAHHDRRSDPDERGLPAPR